MRLPRAISRPSLALTLLLLAGCAQPAPGPTTTEGTTATAGATTAPATPGTTDAAQSTPAEPEFTLTPTTPLVPVDASAAADAPCSAADSADATWLDATGSDPDVDALRLGTGATGVVLLHQNDGRACAWLPFAEQLTEQGYAVIIPLMTPGRWPQPIIAASAEHLRAEGSRSVALVGASMGGTYAMAAAPDLPTPASLVVGVSPPHFYRGADAEEAVGRIDAPILVVVAEDDGALPRSAEVLSETGKVQVLVRPGHAHGITLLAEDTVARDAVLEALAKVGPAG